MTYIIEHDFDQDIPYFVRVGSSTTFDEIYNPKLATQFKTKKEAQQWIDVWSSMKSNSKVVDFDESVQKYDEWIHSGKVRRTLSCINHTMSRQYNNETLEEVIDWWIYQKHNDDEIDYEDYKTWPHLHNISKHLWNVDAYNSSDYKDLYISFSIYTGKDGNFQEFENDLNKVINKVTYKNDDGYLVFSIFDHYLSEHGNSVYLLIHPETKQVKIDGRYSWDENEFSSLEEAFNYIKRERYYE